MFALNILISSVFPSCQADGRLPVLARPLGTQFLTISRRTAFPPTSDLDLTLPLLLLTRVARLEFFFRKHNV